MFRRKKQIDAYDGYGKPGRLYAYGRVVKSRSKHVDFTRKSALYSLGASIKRIFVSVVEDQKIAVRVADSKALLETNSEGYYHIDWEVQSFQGKTPTDHIRMEFTDTPQESVNCRIYCEANLSRFGVISDIDDTVLVTNVNSPVSAGINSLFRSPSIRKSIKGASHWYQKLKVQAESSFFYLSNSPWNFYYYLQNFLFHYKFPFGPILLRDFGLKKEDDLQVYSDHKKNEITRLLGFYPDLNFILIGDGGEHDADTYLDIYRQFPDRISAIFIYRLGDRQKQERIEQLSSGIDVFHFIHDASEGDRICKSLGLYSK